MLYVLHYLVPHEALHETLQLPTSRPPTNTTETPTTSDITRSTSPKMKRGKAEQPHPPLPNPVRSGRSSASTTPKPSLLTARHHKHRLRFLVPGPPIGRPPSWCNIGHPASGASTSSLSSYTAYHITRPRRVIPRSLALIALLRILLRQGHLRQLRPARVICRSCSNGLHNEGQGSCMETENPASSASPKIPQSGGGQGSGSWSGSNRK